MSPPRPREPVVDIRGLLAVDRPYAEQVQHRHASSSIRSLSPTRLRSGWTPFDTAPTDPDTHLMRSIFARRRQGSRNLAESSDTDEDVTDAAVSGVRTTLEPRRRMHRQSYHREPEEYLERLVFDKSGVEMSSWLMPSSLFRGTQKLAGQTSSGQTKDEWAVQVKIQGMDWDTMRICGVMQAFDVPNSAVGTSITTFWEGEIVDFQRHSLKTGKWCSSSKTDITYWRKLEPFRDQDDPEFAQNLVSRKYIKEVCSKFIFMRWKGKCDRRKKELKAESCFVNVDSQESGLTIAGFYFLCLRRRDGMIEGYYFDPSSSPYQLLSLQPMPKTFPTYKFR